MSLDADDYPYAAESVYLRTERARYQLPVRVLAKELKLSIKQVEAIESGKIKPEKEFILKLGELTKMSLDKIDWLLTNYDYPSIQIQSNNSAIISNTISVVNKPILIHTIYTLETISKRFHTVANQLTKRRKQDGKYRITLIIRDEYDVQDLFHSLLLIFFDDIRREETGPSHAGTKPRVDILLKKEQVFVEFKMTREGLDDKEVGKQLILDRDYYSKHPDCKYLFAFVYDPMRYIQNPSGLMSDLSNTYNGLPVKVAIVQG